MTGIYFHTVLEVRSPRTRASRIGFWPETSSCLVDGWVSLCPHMALLRYVYVQRASKLSRVSSEENTNPIKSGPHPCDLVSSFSPPYSKYSHAGGRSFRIWIWAGAHINIQSITSMNKELFPWLLTKASSTCWHSPLMNFSSINDTRAHRLTGLSSQNERKWAVTATSVL